MPTSLTWFSLAGEAVYVDDIPAPADCLQAAFVLSEKALAKIRNVDVQPAFQTPGTVAYISAADIPPNGKNVGVSMGAVSRQALFATDLVECVGHLVGVMVSFLKFISFSVSRAVFSQLSRCCNLSFPSSVQGLCDNFVTNFSGILYHHQIADTYDHAKEAAGRVKVDYDLESVGPPVLSAKEAVERSSFFPVHFLVAGAFKPIDDITEGFAAGEIKLENIKVCASNLVSPNIFSQKEFQTLVS
jgi:xanthine dehydrogenase molybdopterin-binding subunit B